MPYIHSRPNSIDEFLDTEVQKGKSELFLFFFKKSFVNKFRSSIFAPPK
jgi:hypothetical protein